MAKKVEPKKGRFREQQEAEAQAMMRMVMQGLLQRGRSGPQQRRSQRPQRGNKSATDRFIERGNRR